MSRHRRPRRVLAHLLVLASLASACGSTVQVAGTAPGEVAAVDATGLAAGAGDGLAIPGSASRPGAAGAGTAGGAASASAAGSAVASAGTSAGGATGSTAGGPAAGAGSTAAPDGTANPGAPASPPGAAAGDGSTDPIKLGIVFLEGATNVMNGLGTEVSFGDGRLQAQALVDEINSRGGINGRPIEPSYSGVDVGAPDAETEYNATCTELTEDAGVFAVLTPINPPESFVACVAQRQTLLLNASFNPGDDGLYQAFGDWFFSPSLMSLDRAARLQIEALVADGALDDPLTRVGILYTGDPQGPRVVQNTMVPLLDQLGVPYELAEATEVPQVSAAQLQFSARGVTVVMFVHPSGIAQLLFMQAAENQGYRPLYMTSDSDSTRFVSENVAVEQARRIQGIGTLPVANVPVRAYPTTPREERCLEVIRAGGEDNRDRLTNVTATVYCELLWTFEGIASQAPGSLTHDSFRQAYRGGALASYEPVTTFGLDTSVRNDGAALARRYAWDDTCGCLSYTTPPARTS